MGEQVEVIVSDAGGGDEAAADFAEGMVVGAAAAVAADAQETADAAETEASVAVAAALSLEEQVAELRAVVIGMHDQHTEEIATLADAIMLLAEEEAVMEEQVAEAEVDAAIAESDTAELTEIVEDEHSEPEKPADEAAPETSGEPEQPGQHEHSGGRGLRFRRGRR